MGSRDLKSLERRAGAIRSGFVAQGTTLTAWCRTNGFHRPNVYKALMVDWTGPKAEALIAAVTDASTKERAE